MKHLRYFSHVKQVRYLHVHVYHVAHLLYLCTYLRAILHTYVRTYMYICNYIPTYLHVRVLTYMHTYLQIYHLYNYASLQLQSCFKQLLSSGVPFSKLQELLSLPSVRSSKRTLADIVKDVLREQLKACQ